MSHWVPALRPVRDMSESVWEHMRADFEHNFHHIIQRQCWVQWYIYWRRTVVAESITAANYSSQKGLNSGLVLTNCEPNADSDSINLNTGIGINVRKRTNIYRFAAQHLWHELLVSCAVCSVVSGPFILSICFCHNALPVPPIYLSIRNFFNWILRLVFLFNLWITFLLTSNESQTKSLTLMSCWCCKVVWMIIRDNYETSY